jgi:transglutaminase 1
MFHFEVDIYFLFNPWLKYDSCGLLSSNQIAEYVMNEHGQIYLGSSDIPRFIPWYFGQFERAVLLTALILLNKGEFSTQHHPDLSVILRILSSKICSDSGTNNGIFPSSSDVDPSSSEENGYTSSPTILNQYLRSNNHSAQGDSGSNWQHAAVFCSLCRSLGIPCRIVTVYNAIYRTQEEENIDVHWNKTERPIMVVDSKLTW